MSAAIRPADFNPTLPEARYDLKGRSRWAVLGLGLAGAAAFAASYKLAFWNFKLVAPQYPKGLFMQIHLDGVRGDVDEVDIINHYIGMHSLSNAAAMERSLAPYLLGVLGLLTVMGLLFSGRRVHWAILGVAAALPLGFIGDTLYWMYTFGHHLDPRAPIDFAPFMPQLFGHGAIGQFHTWAWPGAGFWVAVAGAISVLAALILRERVCRACPSAENCGATCAHHLVGPAHHEPT